MDNVLHWDENKVSKWLTKIGFGAFEKQFKEHGITGDVLVNLDHETLKDLSIHSVGQRIEILKHIYQLKTAYRIPLNEWDYVPPSALYENDWLGQNGMADYRKIETAFQERDAHSKRLTEDVSRLIVEVSRLKEEMGHMWKIFKDKKPLPSFEIEKSPQTPSMQKGYPHFANNVQHKTGHLLTPPSLSASHAGDYFSGAHVGHDKRGETDEPKHAPTINDGGAIKVYGEKIANSSKVELESSKNVRLLIDDTCAKVITSALKKYNVMDDWQQYALWIKYGPPDNQQERVLGYDEKPLKISQKLKEAKQNPVFILKHVKDNKPFIPNFTSPRPAPKPSQQVHRDDETGWKSSPHQNEKRSAEHPKANLTSGRMGFDAPAPVLSSSASTPTSSTAPSANVPTPVTMVQLPKRAGALNNTSENYLDDLGLESGMANVIYTIMMEQQMQEHK